MERRAGLGVVTVAVLLGECVATIWRPPGVVLVGAPLLPLLVWLLQGRKPRALLAALTFFPVSLRKAERRFSLWEHG